MRSASISEIKKELQTLSPAQLLEICMRLGKYKKDNKELLNYLLFLGHDEASYIAQVKKETDEQFTEINTGNSYYAKKSIRKILRAVNKYIKYTGSKQAEVELLLHFCSALQASGILGRKNTVLNNLYETQVKKIGKALETMHEDLQYDYRKELDGLTA